jgi:hypothetical protein
MEWVAEILAWVALGLAFSSIILGRIARKRRCANCESKTQLNAPLSILSQCTKTYVD